jgi:sugar phosphate isomerase/epimerase
MGDGAIDLPRIRSWMEAAGYRGPHEVEIFSAKQLGSATRTKYSRLASIVIGRAARRPHRSR